jgi:hypothetical protein
MRRHRLSPLGLALLAALAWSSSPLADETLFDFTAAGPDQEGVYVASSDARLEAGEALLALTASPDWYDEQWAYRRVLTITRSASITLPRFTIPLDGAAPELFDLALVDGSDIRIVDPSGALVTPFWVELFGRIQRQGDVRVVATDVPAGLSTWHVYFGGPSSPGHRLDVFSHASPVSFMVPGDPDACAASGLVVMSFVDANTVEAGTTSATLDAGETLTLPAGTLSPETAISATGPVYAAFDTVGDAAAPHRLAGFQFVYSNPRYIERFTVVSPEADATVSVAGLSGVLDTFTVTAGGSTTRDVVVPDLEAASITTDAPVLVIRHGDDPTEDRDFMVMAPPALDLTGPTLGTNIIAALQDATTGTAYYSDGTSESFALDALGTHTLALTGTQGSGPAVRIVANRPVSVISYADGDGGEMVTFLPTRWLGTTYVVPFDAQYVYVAAPQPGTQCRLDHGGGTNVRTADSLAPPYAKRLFWGSTTNGANLLAPITLTCDAPVHASAERTLNDDEVNLWPLRFFRGREPDLSFEWATGVQARYTTGAGTVTTPVFHPPLGVKTWDGFEERGGTQAPEGTSLGYLLSVDGGSTWLTYAAGEWTRATGSDAALDATRVDAEIGSLPAGATSLTVQAVLRSTHGADTPRLDELAVVYTPPGPLAALRFDPVPAVVTSGVPVGVSITAEDADGTTVTSFEDSVLLFTEPATVDLLPASSPAFTAGQADFDLTFQGEDVVTLVALSGDARGEAGPIQVVASAGSPALLEKVGGDDQFGPAGSVLPLPLEVRVLDDEARPVPGVTVDFEVSAGGGTIEPGSTFTDASGVAAATWTLGPEPGANHALVDAGDIEGSPASFVARADPEDGSSGSPETSGCGCAIVH